MNSAMLPIFDREVYRSLSQLLDEEQGDVRLGDTCATYSPPVSGAMVWAALRQSREVGLVRPVIWHNVVNLRSLVSWPVGAPLGRQRSAGGFQGRGSEFRRSNRERKSPKFQFPASDLGAPGSDRQTIDRPLGPGAIEKRPEPIRVSAAFSAVPW